MEEVIVEGLNFEDFVTLKDILLNNTSFNYKQYQLHADTGILILYHPYMPDHNY